MPHFVVYNKQSGEIVNRFKMSSNRFLPNPPSPETAIVEVTEKKDLQVMDAIAPFREEAQGKVVEGKIQGLKARPIFKGKIVLSTDALDRDGDGRPELPADGASGSQIMATIQDLKGKTIQKAPAIIKFRTSRGLLSKREVETKDGVAEIALKSVAETTMALISATSDGFETGKLEVEFIPTEEFKSFPPSRLDRAR
jgi:hypothetical protein